MITLSHGGRIKLKRILYHLAINKILIDKNWSLIIFYLNINFTEKLQETIVNFLFREF